MIWNTVRPYCSKILLQEGTSSKSVPSIDMLELSSPIITIITTIIVIMTIITIITIITTTSLSFSSDSGWPRASSACSPDAATGSRGQGHRRTATSPVRASGPAAPRPCGFETNQLLLLTTIKNQHESTAIQPSMGHQWFIQRYLERAVCYLNSHKISYLLFTLVLVQVSSSKG